ncbi:Gfo/Idh/MocA family protein [Epibacterium ulvae]|uniref:Gfo/Idh/MocA family protein n=1 Tax=Epibacterium ulvae TaxID=1156985 RepID=UPI0024930E60|nr:Gfo/Idh/MocA family oxidoreductase [Epibacterium ulvae]
MVRHISYGIIGCGMMGQEHLRNIALLPETSIAAIYEPDADMARIAQSFAPKAQMMDSIDALLEVENLDCLVIVSPNHCHMEQLELLAEKRPLPVLVEKPLFTDPDDIQRLNHFQAHYPAPVWVAMEYRYMPPVATLLSDAEAATGGIKMLTIREHRFPFLEKVGDWNRFNRYTGGTFVEKCCHFFDLMRFALKAEPVRIMASGAMDANHLEERYEGQTPDILDNGYVIVDFNNGTRAMLELCMFAEGSRYQEEISAVGPDGKIEALVPGPGRFWPEHLGTPPIPQVIVSPRSPKGPHLREIPVDPRILDAGDHNGSTFYQHQGFLDLVRGNRESPDVTLEDGKRAVQMGLAAQRSITEKRVVEMSEFA